MFGGVDARELRRQHSKSTSKSKVKPVAIRLVGTLRAWMRGASAVYMGLSSRISLRLPVEVGDA